MFRKKCILKIFTTKKIYSENFHEDLHDYVIKIAMSRLAYQIVRSDMHTCIELHDGI